MNSNNISELVPTTRICSTCREEKPLEDFGFLTNSYLGRSYVCRLCVKKRNKQDRLLHSDDYKLRTKFLIVRSVWRRITNIFNGLKARYFLEFGRLEFDEWILSECSNFYHLWNNYENSGFDFKLKPCVMVISTTNTLKIRDLVIMPRNAWKEKRTEVIRNISLNRIINKKYGRLTGLEFWENKNRRSYALFVCDCGNLHVTDIYNVVSGYTTSCGCFQKNQTSKLGKRNKTHGRSNTLEYVCYRGIIKRCYSISHPRYKTHGGNGIKVCDRWLGEYGFENFLTDMGERPSPKHRLIRIDKTKDFCPENCKWEKR